MQILKPLLFFMFLNTCYGQNLTKADSLKLLSTWEKTSKYILSNDTLKLRAFCLDTIECTVCGYENDTIDYRPINYFLKNGLIKLNRNKKLSNIISSNKPEMIIVGFIRKNERTYGIAFTYYMPNELGKKHEGVQVVFDYVLRQGFFKLTSISTIP